MPLRAKIVSIFVVSEIFFGGAAFADAVDESLKKAMHDCVSVNADRIGSPFSDIESWASLASLMTSLSFSLINISGIDDHPDIQSALEAKTEQFLIQALEERGLKNFRGQVIETVEYCLPFAIVAAAEETIRQANAACPDDTNYRGSVEIVLATDAALKSKYGKYVSDVRRTAVSGFWFDIVGPFPEVFAYGSESYPRIGTDGGDSLLDGRLMDIGGKIETEVLEATSAPFSDIGPLVSSAMEAASQYRGAEQVRVAIIERQLLCLKDRLDIYPADEISKLKE